MSSEQAIWERKLRKAGLPDPDELIPGKVDLKTVEAEAHAREFRNLPEEDMQEALTEFASLPERLKQGVIRDMKQCREKGMPYERVIERLRIVIDKSRELADIKSAGSDATYVPQPSPEQEKLRRELDDNMQDAPRVDRLIQELEKQAEPPPAETVN